MPQFVSCPNCGRRARIPDALLGQRVKCPGCAQPFTAKPSAPTPATAKGEPAKEERAAGGGEDIEVVDDAEEGSAAREDRDEARRSRRRRQDDEEEDRPRKKKKRRRAQGEGPWLIAIGVAGACLVVAFLISIVANGTMGLEPAKDGPIVKYLALGLGLVAALAMTGLGVDAVRKREMWTRYGFSQYTITGTAAIVLGLFQTAVGGFLCGWVVYGLFFTALRGR